MRTESILQGKSTAFKARQRGEDDEGVRRGRGGDTLPLDAGFLNPTPSILLTANQLNGNRRKREVTDWLGSSF